VSPRLQYLCSTAAAAHCNNLFMVSWSQHQASVSERMHAEKDMLLLLVTDDNDEPIVRIWLRLLSAALIAVCDRRPFRSVAVMNELPMVCKQFGP